jgi:hypothetical protein
MKIVVLQVSDPDFDSLVKVEMIEEFADPEGLDLLSRLKAAAQSFVNQSPPFASYAMWGLTVYDFLTMAMEMEKLPEPFQAVGIASISAVEFDLIFPQDTYVIEPSEPPERVA